jgi:phospholipid/cholesterol/gamma-HCH transport system substrate-binding protein
LAGRSKPGYRVDLVMPSAYGIRKSSDVRIGGASVGSVTALHLTRDDQVLAQLTLHDDAAPVGRDASADIRAVNLLGDKYVELEPGNADHPAPSGATVPASRVTPSVDLDQVLNVLDTDTRSRLAILINETGRALTGRGQDFQRLLDEAPGGLGQARALLAEVVADNHTLGDVIDRTDALLATTVREKAGLGNLVDSAQAAASTFATRTAQLRETLRNAPEALTTLRGFLAQLRRTAVPLGPAARNLATTAPALNNTLAALPAFTDAARPTLGAAVDAAPALTQLADGATPVVRRAQPTLRALDRFATTAAPASTTLGRSIDDTLGVLEGWGRATSARDGLGHTFHGRVILTPDALREIVGAINPVTARKVVREHRRNRPAPAATPVATSNGITRPRADSPLVQSILGQLGATLDTTQQHLDQVTGATPLKPLLDYLLRP